MFDQDEPFCNPIAPVDHQESNQQPTIQKQNLSNEDFRKLAMTPSANRAFGGMTPAFGLKGSASVRGNRRQVIASDGFKKPQSTVPLSEAAAERKKNKKKYHQKKKEDDDEDSLTEIMKNYRDRAKERRDNKNEEEEQLITMGNYNAVANLTNEDAAERRKQLIEESKYLGGDMEHTHLVKGLDYALLHKVKAELEFKRDQETLELVRDELEKHENDDELDDDENNNEDDWEIKSSLAKNLMTILFENNLPERNDYFLPGRLAYVFDLENDCPSDAFTSVIRSKAECPSWDQLNTLSTNDIVINKLIEIFEELREQGGRRKKKLKPETTKSDDNSKFNFINSFGSNKSTTGSPGRSETSKLNRSIESADLNSIYDQELNVESIIKNSKAKVENDLNIYDDLDDYVLPHKLEKDDRKRKDDRHRSSSRYDDRKYDRDYETRYDRDRHHDRDYDRERRRKRSSSRERRHYSSSSDEERYKYKDNYSRRKDHQARTPDRYHSSSSKRTRY